jgi:hypothetical protein
MDRLFIVDTFFYSTADDRAEDGSIETAIEGRIWQLESWRRSCHVLNGMFDSLRMTLLEKSARRRSCHVLTGTPANVSKVKEIYASAMNV